MSLYSHIRLSISICLFVVFIHIFLCLSLHYMYLYLYLYPIFPYLSLYFCICNRGELVRTADLSVAGQGDASGQLRLHKMRKSISIRHRSQTSTSAFLTFSSVVSRSTSKMSITLSKRLVISLVRAQEWLDEIRNLFMMKGMNRFCTYEKTHCIEFSPVIHVFWTITSESTSWIQPTPTRVLLIVGRPPRLTSFWIISFQNFSIFLKVPQISSQILHFPLAGLAQLMVLWRQPIGVELTSWISHSAFTLTRWSLVLDQWERRSTQIHFEGRANDGYDAEDGNE